MIVGAAFILGLMGSLHCLGMCGPIALALPVHNLSPWQKTASIVLYNVGRIATYSIIGMVFGLAGWGVVMGGFQQTLSIILGVVLILAAFFPIVSSKFRIVALDQFVSKVKSGMGYYLKSKTLSAFFTLGILNGFLPCGLVYVALVGALAVGSIGEGALFMALFGLGTAPAMIALPYLSGVLKKEHWQKLRRLIPFTLAMFGVLLLLRGLDLGIPFLSPQLTESGSMECCH